MWGLGLWRGLVEGGGWVDGWRDVSFCFLFFKNLLTYLLTYLLTACVLGLWVVAVVVLFLFSSSFLREGVCRSKHGKQTVHRDRDSVACRECVFSQQRSHMD